MLAPFKIKWQGLSSLEFDVWTEIAFDEDNGDVDSHLSREAIVSEAYNGTLKRAHSYRWDNDFVTTVTFIKQNYSDFTPEENRKILKWLTGSKNASYLEIYKDDSEVAEYYILGNWTSVSQQKLGNGRVVGYVAEFESLTPWAFSDIQSVTKEIVDPTNNTISLYVETDEPQDLIYPRITIKNKTVNLFNNIYSQDGRIENGVEKESPSDVLYKRTDFITIPDGLKKIYIYLQRPPLVNLTIHCYDSDKKYLNDNISFQDNENSKNININDSFPLKYIRISVPKDFSSNILVTEEPISENIDWMTADADRSISLTNTNEDGEVTTAETKISNNTYEEEIIIDGANRVISSNNRSDRIFGDDFNWNWLGLAEGENTLSVVGKCEVTVEWREPIKCGEW